MPRRKPTSTRQKKADIQLKRAIKRGDVPPPDPQKKPPKPKVRRGPTGTFIGHPSDHAHAVVHAARRLQSSFVVLPSNFLDETKVIASKLPLTRPIPDTAVIYSEDFQSLNDQKLTCPRRPKWRYDMTKEQVESNEEGVFKKWLDQMDRFVIDWQKESASQTQESKDEPPLVREFVNEELDRMPRSTTYFERNLEVWRQLWRVTEISQILLVLLDSRCPLMHFPPSLASYISGRKIILVLTKIDITGPERTSAWVEYFHKKYPHLPVVPIESYTSKKEGKDHQGGIQYEPHLSPSFRERLVTAIRQVHSEMLIPPEKVRINPERLTTWKPSVKVDVDWDEVMEKSDVKLDNTACFRLTESEGEEMKDNGGQEVKASEFLTIGLIGQPNVGKSSLLNALFGMNKVRASKSPGKTKHFQTLFWTPHVRLVDCPGLVMPNFVPLELQVLCGILPISRISAVPSSVFFAAERLPIERVYGLEHPGLSLPSTVDKRTWRDGVRPDIREKKPLLVWTAMNILVAYATRNKWVTAKAGRPDIHRAGNALLRALAEGRIGWAFWPPGTDLTSIKADIGEQGNGIWIPHAGIIEDDENANDSDEPDEDEKSIVTSSYEETSDEDKSSEEAEYGSERKMSGISGFGALSVDDVEEDDESGE
ncbi:hypothetical protein C0993_008622 [Termitomyces sp. T159_Od127]|nr:hypothetical protein C0993_008622 [Termitomyces sp. T159_Od127]